MLSQGLEEKWFAADCAAKRQILDITCLNLTLDGTTLIPTMRKPFDVLAEGLISAKHRGDCPSFEPVLQAFIEEFSRPSLKLPRPEEFTRESA